MCIEALTFERRPAYNFSMKFKNRGGVSLTSPGSFVLGIFLLVIFGLAIMLSRGIFPSSTLTDPGETGDLEIIDEAIDPNGNDNLQLRTIKFRECAQTAAIGMLADNSGSMGAPPFSPAKMSSLKSALGYFVGQLGDDSVASLRTFSDGQNLITDYGFIKDIRPQLLNGISSMDPRGGTSTRTAFVGAQEDLQRAINDPKYKDYTFNLIFFSDGIPETQATNVCGAGGVCGEAAGGGCRCFADSEDPTNASLPGGNLAQSIKDLKSANGKNVNVYSVLLFDEARDGFAASKFKPMMQGIASEGNFYETPSESELQNIFKQIAQKICKDL